MQALGSTDEHFRLLVEAVRDYAIFMLDSRGRVASWNAGAEQIKGYSADEVIGRHFSIFYRREDVERGLCESQLEIAARDGRCESAGWRVRKDGSQFWANVVITALRDDAGTLIGFAKITRDLTDSAYRTFIEATHAIIWTTDASGRPNADSPTWREFTGQSETDWRTHGFDAVHPDDRGALTSAWDEARANRAPFSVEIRLREREGDWRWIEARAIPLLDRNNEVREWFGVTLDIAERKEAEEEREAALAREQTARHEAERARAELATTLASIGDAVIVTDPRGHVTFMNVVAESLTRWTSESAYGKPLTDVFPIVNEETRRPVANPVEKVLREGVVVGLANHTVIVRRDGSDVPIDDSAAPIRDAEGKLLGVVLVFRDVSAEKQEAARRDFLVHAGAALIAAPDYHDSLATVARLAVPRLADWCAVQILEPGDVAPRDLAVAHVDSSKVTAARETLRRYRPNPSAGVGAANVIRTGRSELLRRIDDHVLDAIAVNDKHRAALQTLGLRSAMIVPMRGRERIFGAITFVHAESHREYNDSDLVFAEELARRAGIVIERRKLEEQRAQLLDSERALRAQSEMANRAKDAFLATVSHELRNPLSTILGWAKIMAASELPENLREPVKTIERNARAQQRLVDDMLDMSRIISGKLRLQIARVDVGQTVADSVESPRKAAEAKGIAINTQVARGMDVEADPVRLQQIVTNLVSNAVKFTPRGGLIEVTAACEGPYLEIRVSDTGEGIDPDRLAAIFEPFKQEDASTTRRHGGLGLGLAIVRELVAAHGGHVRAESLGKRHGATFIVELPVKCGTDSVVPSPPEHVGPLPHLEGTSVLVVDDDPDAMQLLASILSQAGASTITATSADDAIIQLRQSRPDIVVSDIGMPDVDGYDFLRRVRALPAAEGGRTPAIALTAFARPDDARRAFEAGFQRHVTKPIDPAEIVLTVANLAGLPLGPRR